MKTKQQRREEIQKDAHLHWESASVDAGHARQHTPGLLILLIGDQPVGALGQETEQEYWWGTV